MFVDPGPVAESGDRGVLRGKEWGDGPGTCRQAPLALFSGERPEVLSLCGVPRGQPVACSEGLWGCQKRVPSQRESCSFGI